MSESLSRSPTPVIEFQDIVKRYGPTIAVDDVSIAFQPGEIAGLVGKNGAGKSTLIKMMAGVVAPDSGSMSVDGERVTLKSPHDAWRSGLAFVHQELLLVPNLTVAENVWLGLRYPRRLGGLLDSSELRRRVVTLLERLGEDIDPNVRVDRLSVAQQKMTMIARGIAQDARLLVLDEPSASLSDTEITKLHDVLRSLCSDGVAIVYVSHRLNEIAELTERTVVMKDGRVVRDVPSASMTRSDLIRSIAGTASSERVLGRKESSGHGAAAPGTVLLKASALSSRRVPSFDLELRTGQVTGIAGLVGSGRTELAELLAGIDRPTGGTLEIHGEPVRLTSPRKAMRRGIVLLPEDRKAQGNVLKQSITWNIALPSLARHRAVKGVPVTSRRREVASSGSMIERLAVKARDGGQSVGTLSGGNQQKVVFAKWLFHGADVFIFDEPTQGIDAEGREDVYESMESLAAEGKAILFVSSDFTELVGVCTRVLAMREGRLVADLNGADVSEELLLRHCYGFSESS
ncbi:MAG: Ribose transport system ATP-binding protein [Marmoricola sp.]|nr:Ribose transport system ATP-binding protein [Marmoricola sp.]